MRSLSYYCFVVSGEKVPTCKRGELLIPEASNFVLRSIDTLVEVVVVVVREASRVLVCCHAETRQHRDMAKAAHGRTTFTSGAMPNALLLLLLPAFPIIVRSSSHPSQLLATAACF